jgi:hypothetical protein
VEYPFPEEVLNREYGRLMLKYVGNPHHRNWWKKAEGITKEHEKATRNKFLREMWDEHPEEWIALKARVKLGVEDIKMDTFYNILKRKNIVARVKAKLGVK